jgi:DNA-binding response OmpR family regulator
MRSLVIEDDPKVARLVQRALNDAGHQADVANDGPDGLALGEAGSYDLIVMDVMLPGMDGLAVCRALRGKHIRTPVLMLTAKDTIADRVHGLDAGADDYLVKPFALEELLARVRALSRRGADPIIGEVLRIGDLELRLQQHEASRAGEPIPLTPREFTLLEYLMRHPGLVLTKEQIINYVWGYDADVTPAVVETYVHYLRNKVDANAPRPLIRTVRGVGYMLKG